MCVYTKKGKYKEEWIPRRLCHHSLPFRKGTTTAILNIQSTIGYDSSMSIGRVQSEHCSCINFDSILVSIFIFFTLMYSQDDPSNLCAYATNLLLTGAETAPDSTQ
jgi:hypothetical protein